MRKKEHVERLSWKWSRSFADNSQTERDILDELQPNANIKEIEIAGYRGTKIPNWLADHSFHKLIEVSLSYCKDCDSLPALGQLPCLKFLTIRGMHQITEVTEEFYGSSSSTKPFNSLEKLEFAKMPEWKLWHLQRLPCLRDLTIHHDGSDEEVLAGEKWELPCSIRRLSISNLKTLSSQLLKSLTSLEYLYASELPQIQSLLEEGLPSSLSELKLFSNHDLHSLPTEGLQRLMWLRCLEIWDCPSLQSLPKSGLPSSLSELCIGNCSNLQSLPESWMPPSISNLNICKCPLLKPLLEFNKGDYWPKIAHIPTIYIDGEYQ